MGPRLFQDRLWRRGKWWVSLSRRTWEVLYVVVEEDPSQRAYGGLAKSYGFTLGRNVYRQANCAVVHWRYREYGFWWNVHVRAGRIGG